MYDYSATIDALRQDHDRKKRQLDLLYEDRLSERISGERYDELHNKIAQEQADIEQNMTNIADNSRKRLKTGIDVLEKSQQAAIVYAKKSPEEKRKLIEDLFTSLTLDGTQLFAEYNPYSLAISKQVEKHQKVIQHFRTNKKAPSNRSNDELTETLRTVWRARPDSNRRSPP